MYRSINFLIGRFVQPANKNRDVRDVPAVQGRKKRVLIRHFGNAIPDARFSEHDRGVFRVLFDLLP